MFFGEFSTSTLMAGVSVASVPGSEQVRVRRRQSLFHHHPSYYRAGMTSAAYVLSEADTAGRERRDDQRYEVEKLGARESLALALDIVVQRSSEEELRRGLKSVA